jgi:hypothetical protein
LKFATFPQIHLVTWTFCLVSSANSNTKPTNEDYVIAKIQVEADANESLLSSLKSLPVTFNMMKDATQKDDTLRKILDFVRNGWPEKSKISNDVISFFNRKDSLSIVKECLMSGERLIIPKIFQPKILNELHRAHPGIVRMKSIARSYVYCPNIDQEIESFVKNLLAMSLSCKTSAQKHFEILANSNQTVGESA